MWDTFVDRLPLRTKCSFFDFTDIYIFLAGINRLDLAMEMLKKKEVYPLFKVLLENGYIIQAIEITRKITSSLDFLEFSCDLDDFFKKNESHFDKDALNFLYQIACQHHKGSDAVTILAEMYYRLAAKWGHVEAAIGICKSWSGAKPHPFWFKENSVAMKESTAVPMIHFS